VAEKIPNARAQIDLEHGSRFWRIDKNATTAMPFLYPLDYQ
jgi:hypothetical protein